MEVKRLFSSITDEQKNAAVENLFAHSTPNNDFFLMVILSVLMATLGLLIDSSAVIVGSMLIAPILYPMLGLAMGIIMSDFSLTSKSFVTIIKAAILSIAVAAIVTLLFSSETASYTSEIISRTKPSLIYAFIGAVAGFAAAFATTKPKLTETLPGVAISVALIPPLAVVGIGLARLDIAVFFSSLLLFLVNAAGVIFTAAIVFSLMNFYEKRNIAKKTVKEGEAEIKKENAPTTTAAK